MLFHPILILWQCFHFDFKAVSDLQTIYFKAQDVCCLLESQLNAKHSVLGVILDHILQLLDLPTRAQNTAAPRGEISENDNLHQTSAFLDCLNRSILWMNLSIIFHNDICHHLDSPSGSGAYFPS